MLLKRWVESRMYSSIWYLTQSQINFTIYIYNSDQGINKACKDNADNSHDGE